MRNEQRKNKVLVEKRQENGFDYGGVYFTAMQRAAGEYLRGAGKAARRVHIIRVIWYGVKYFNTCAIRETLEEVQELYRLQGALVGLMCELSPADIVRIFPPTKVYNRARAGKAEYFATMRAARSLGYVKPLGQSGQVYYLLWNYGNEDIERFNTQCGRIVKRWQEIAEKKPAAE